MSLIGWWPFTTDGRNQGTISTANASGYTLEENGKLGKCAFFNKVKYNSDINYINSWNPYTTGMTMAGWVKVKYSEYKAYFDTLTFTSTSHYATGNFFGTTSYGGAGVVWTSNSIINDGSFKQLNVLGYIRGSNTLVYTNNFTMPDNVWTHLALVADPVTKIASFYINGVLKQDFSYASLTPHNDTRVFGINKNEVYSGNGPGVSGPARFNDVRLYDHPLTAGEIRELSQGLLVHYDFNYLDTGSNIIVNPNDWANRYTKPDGSGQSAIGTATAQADDSLKIVDNNTNTRIRYVTNPEAKQGETYLVSIKYKLISGDETFRWQIQELNSSGGVAYTHWTHTNCEHSDLEEGWKLISYVCNVQHTDTTNLRFWLQDGADYTTYTHTYYIKDFCVQKVNTEQVIDSSGHGYSATINKSHFIKDTARGQYAFRTKSMGAPRTDPVTSASYIKGDIGSLITPTAFTVSSWMKVSEYGLQTSGLMHIGSASDASSYLTGTFAQYDGSFRLNKSVDSSQYTISTSLIPDTNWHHVAITWDGATMCGYLDGALKLSTAATGTVDPFRYIFLGVDKAGGALRDADVTWGEFKLYMTALNADAIKDIATTKTYVFDDGSLMAPDLIETDNGLLVTEAGILQSNKFYESISDEYDHLEYIESTNGGGQYINTGLPASTKLRKLTAHLNLTTSKTSQILFGSSAAGYYFYREYDTARPNYGAHGPGGPYIQTALPMTPGETYGTIEIGADKSVSLTITKNTGSDWVSETKTGTHKNDFSGTDNSFLFGYNNSGSLGYPVPCKLYSFKVWSDAGLIRDFIPAKRRSDGAIGLYDAVNKQFYTNAGSGTFTAGPVLTDRNAAFFESQNAAGRNIIEV